MDEISFKDSVIKIIQEIPFGRVTTYGTIAIMAGSPRSAREVGYILHSVTKKYNLPWQRVVNVKGYISNRGGDMNIKKVQKSLLEQEGVRVSEEFVIDLEKYGWWGKEKTLDYSQLEK